MEMYGLIIHTLGELLVAATVLRVHHRIVHDKRVDQPVLKELKTEQVLGVLGALLILIGFCMELQKFL